MKRRNQLASLLLTACMAGGCLAGCGGNTKAPEESSVKNETTAKEVQNETSGGAAAGTEEVDPYGPVSEEKTVIHVGRAESANVTYPDGEDSHNNYIVKYLQDQLNTEYIYDFSVDDASYPTKVAMAIASGDMPDVMNVTYTQLVQLVNAGAVEDMTDAFATYRSDALKKCFDSANGMSEGLATFDGRLMAIPDIQPGMDSVPLVYIRGDWMEELGLEEPKSLDDIVNIAKTFMEKNPGGNVTDGIAVGLSSDKKLVQKNGGTWHVNGLFTLFDAYPKMWIKQDDGSVVYGSITEEAKTALGEIRTLVEEGVIDPSFAVRDSEQCVEMISNGQAGIFFGAWWSNQWPVVSMLEGAADSVKWNSYVAPLNAEGKLNVPMKSPTTTYIVVKKGCSEEIKEAVVNTVNYQYDLDQSQAENVRPNGMDSPFSWHYYPINVLHCDYDAKEKQIQSVMDCIDGKVAYDDLSGDGKTWYNGYTAVQKDGFRKTVEKNISTANGWGWANGAWTVQSQADKLNLQYAASYADSPSMESLWATLETQEDEFYLQVLTGNTSVDEFDKFVSQWKALGGDTITQEMTELSGAN